MSYVPTPIPQKLVFSDKEITKRREFCLSNINSGRLREFPWISIDRFFGEDLKANIFILTHCHTDHMVGLDEDEFWQRLQEPYVKLYLSEITPMLMPLFYRFLRGKDGIQYLLNQNKLVPLPYCRLMEIEEPVTGTLVKLTLLPAGHCPGSVMLQFEYDDQCILYTGDCRISVSDLKKLDSLHTRKRNRSGDNERLLKTITHLYIDTTFCSTRSQDFPGRVDVLDELVINVRRWFDKCSENCVNLSFSARFSHEHVLQRFYDEFGIQSHVNEERYEAYRKIPKILNSVTLSQHSKFHLCEAESSCLINSTGNRGKLLTIRLSSLWFMRNEDGSGAKYALQYDKKKKRVTVCYAMHSSLDEIADMTSYLKPQVVTPLVLPNRMNRAQLESELRRSAKGDYVFEDYINGLDTKTVLTVKNIPHDRPTQLTYSDNELTVLHPLPISAPIVPKSRVIWDFRWSPSPPPLER